MPIRHCIVHLIDKKPDGTPAVLQARDSELAESQAIENMLADLNESYNAKQGKAWGFFHAESGAHPFSGWLKEYMDGGKDFTAFSRVAVEHLQKLMEESNLSVGGHVLFAHYQQGMTDYLAIALLHHSEGVAVSETLDVTPSRHLDLGQLHLAARINVSEWQNNKQSKQYIFRSSRARTAKRSRNISATSLAVRKASTAPVKPAPCSRRSVTSSRAKTCPKMTPGRKPRPWWTTPAARAKWASPWAWKNCPA
jgi:nucleoid-associated protein YejK